MDSVSVALVFLPVFINRMTEAFKLTFVKRFNLDDDDQKNIVLLLSLILGALGVVFVFPSFNLIKGQGASILAEQIVTGVIVGGLANGVDFLATTGANTAAKYLTPTAPAA